MPGTEEVYEASRAGHVALGHDLSHDYWPRKPRGRPPLSLHGEARVKYVQAQRRRIVNNKNREARANGLCGYCHKVQSVRFYCHSCATGRAERRKSRAKPRADMAAE